MRLLLAFLQALLIFLLDTAAQLALITVVLCVIYISFLVLIFL